jgi:S1-C subfamily serine protease
MRRTPLLLLAAAALLAPALGRAQEIDKRVLEAEKKRIEAVDKVRMSVLAIFAPGFNNGGSGVVISEDGYALTNFHVVMAPGHLMATMKCGLPDGKLYDAVLVGIDKVGDVALIKLLPKKEGDKFKFAPLGDSDKVRAGDWSLAMGNPFLLATDFTPTVTFGLVSGVHRYQFPEGGLLEYTDCIQIDTSINPGNSGGPLFNMDGELIGINGRGSFEKRVRINSGVGYAISINQIKNFMGQLRAGMETDHASLGALVGTESEDEPVNKMVVQRIIPSDASRRGLDLGDNVLFFAGRPMSSANNLKNVLGIFPRGWRLPLVYRRDAEKREILVRLMGVIKQELPAEKQDDPKQPPQPQQPPPPPPSGPAAKFFEAKPGFANFYFNKLERDKLLTAFATQCGDFNEVKGDWTIALKGNLRGAKKETNSTIEILEKGASTGPVVKAKIDGVDDDVELLGKDVKTEAFKVPAGSGGLLAAIYMYKQVVTAGTANVSSDITDGGTEPFYPLAADGSKPDYSKVRVDCDVLRSKFSGFTAKWYFSPKDHTLLGGEVMIDREEDPCELYFSDYKKVDGRMLPHHIDVHYGDKTFASWSVESYKLNPAAK